METHPSSVRGAAAPRTHGLHVIVVGAGLGGLCLAQGLRQAGISFAVYERDASPESRTQGHRLHIDTHGRRALANVLPQHRSSLLGAIAGRPAPRVSGFDDQLAPTQVFPLQHGPGSFSELAHGMPAHTVLDRDVLRKVLLTGLDDAIEYGRRCVGYDATEDGVEARFDDGSVARGSLLVGADGIGSAIRAQRLPHARVVDCGVRLIYGRVPLTAGLREALPPAMVSVFNSVVGPGQRFIGLAPVQYRERPDRAARRLAPEVALGSTEDSLAVMFGRRLELIGLNDDALRQATGEQLRDLVLEQIHGWHPLLRRVIEEWSPSTVHPITVRSSVPISPWSTSNVTLLGDAIHAMSPAAGAGANTALADGAALAAALAHVSDRQSMMRAVQDYEHRMIEQGFRMVRRSAENGVRTLGANPLPVA